MNESDASDSLVSVIALCYNHERYVAECLDSIRSQTFTHIELIIVDDASHDQSVAIIDEWLRTNAVSCRFLRHPHNMGICKSVNDALSYATGKYVAVVATDDVWLPTKLEHQVRLMDQASENVGVLYCNAFRMDETGKTEGEVLPMRCTELGLEEIPQGNVHVALWKGNFIPAVTALVRRSCYAKVGTYDESLFYEDYDMWLRMSCYFEFQYSPALVAKYRIVYNSAVRSDPNRLYDSKARIFWKFLSDPSVAPALRQVIADKFVEFQATEEFRRRSQLRHGAIWRALRLVGGPKYSMMLLFSIVGLSFKHYAKAMGGLQRLARFMASIRRNPL